MALSNPTATLHAWLLDRIQAALGTRARLTIVGDDWIDNLLASGQRVDLEWGLTPHGILSSVIDLGTNRAVLSYSLVGAWSGVSRNLDWTDRQVRQVTNLQRTILTAAPPADVDHIESGQATSIDRAKLVAWDIPVIMRCEVED